METYSGGLAEQSVKHYYAGAENTTKSKPKARIKNNRSKMKLTNKEK